MMVELMPVPAMIIKQKVQIENVFVMQAAFERNIVRIMTVAGIDVIYIPILLGHVTGTT